MAKTKEQTLVWLRSISGELATATLQRLDDTLPWYGDMPPGRRSAVGLVAQAGITSFISWFDDPKSTPWIAADVFGAAPRELLRSVSLQQTLQLIRVTVEVVEDRVKGRDEADRGAAPGRHVAVPGERVLQALQGRRRQLARDRPQPRERLLLGLLHRRNASRLALAAGRARRAGVHVVQPVLLDGLRRQ